jgi:hypothetical protein
MGSKYVKIHGLYFYKKIVRQCDLEFKIIYPRIVHYALSVIKIVYPQAVVGTIKYNLPILCIIMGET